MSGRPNRHVAVFVGPTAYGIDRERECFSKERFNWFPPIERNDLSRLPSHYDTVVIVDGLFHAKPAVSHIEIRQALVSRAVYGCSSMGAIRAYEMRDMGMIGFGQVYRMFFKFEDFTDDEVALLHGPAPKYAPLSEPLVNIRCFLDEVVGEKKLTRLQASAIVEELRVLYYGYRTVEAFYHLLLRFVSQNDASAMITRFSEHRVKARDFIKLLRLLDDGIAPKRDNSNAERIKS